MSTTTQFRTSKVPFLKEWNEAQFMCMKKAITSHFRNRDTRTMHGNYYLGLSSFRAIDSIFGLAYTSTGIWACYGVCNTQVYFDADKIYQYSYFTIGEDVRYYAVLTDNEENELVIQL